jgi:anion-transporting  ArsA/GET3 family ATPase
MMLDLKAAWDDMLFRTAPDRETAERILENRFYTALSRDLPGAHEFIACEALQHIASTGAYDLVVLDTPPTSNALDFLEAPQRILSVLDNEAFRFFAAKSEGFAAKLGLRFLDGAASRAQSVLARFTGQEMLDELGEFIVLLRDLYGPLTTRTRAFEELLRSDATRFLIVTSPEPGALHEAAFFSDELTARNLHIGAAIVNRVTSSPDTALDALADPDWQHALVARGVDQGEVERLGEVLGEAARQQEALAHLDAGAIAGLALRLSGRVPIVRAPRLPGDIHDLTGLASLLPWLVGEPRDTLG